jgi:undecaprenyl-diphosphatase
MFLDTAIFNFIHGLVGWSVFTDAIGVFFAQYLAYILAIAALFFVFKEKEFKKRAKIFFQLTLAALISRGILTETIRFLYDRPRPFSVFNFTPLVSDSSASFPSGHAAFFFALGFIILSINRRWGLWFLSLAFLNGLARIFAGVHYPSDIIGGILVGFAGYWITRKFLIRNEEPVKESAGEALL